MPGLDITVNMISIFAFIVVLGIVTDDAIVVGENVYERMRKGETGRIAAPRGAYEVMIVAIFGVFTVMLSFVPMLGISGVSGKIWRNIPWVVIPVLIVSLIETNLILPAHLSRLKPEKPDDQVGWFTRLQRMLTRGVDKFVDHYYRGFMERALRHRYITLSAFIAAAAIIIGLIGGGFIKTEFFPKVEGEVVSAKLTLANGVPVEQTQAAIARIEAAAAHLNEQFKTREGKPVVEHMLATVGTQPFKQGFQPENKSAASNIGEVTLQLAEAASRDVTGDEIIAKWRELTGPVPGAVEMIFVSNTANTGNAFDLEFHGPNLNDVNAAAALFKQRLGEFKGVTDIADNNREGKREARLSLTPQGEIMSLRIGDVARQVRQAFYGEEIQRLQRGRDEVKVMVRYPKAERLSQANLDGMMIRMPDGAEIPFGTVAVADAGRGYSSIYRAQRQRAVRVTADIDKTVPGANANEVVAELESRVFPEISGKFPTVHYAFQGEQENQRQSMKELQMGNILCLVGIFILLAVPLRSYVQPLIVMSVIPFGVVGAIIGHLILGLELSIMSMIGIVALSGVVVNESLVLVEFVNRHRRGGRSVVEAAREGGCARFQAIMLTSVTSFIGVMPIVTETSLQAKFLIPCGVSLAFGCLFNMLNSLVLVPCVYAILEDIKRAIFTREKLQKWEDHEREEAAERGLEWMSDQPGESEMPA
jgi:multidrug efflux pump subunit AcrB